MSGDTAHFMENTSAEQEDTKEFKFEIKNEPGDIQNEDIDVSIPFDMIDIDKIDIKLEITANESQPKQETQILITDQQTTVSPKQLKRKTKSYECNVCKKTFYSKSNFIQHITIHTGERPFECDVCKKTFCRKSYFVKHKRIHTGEKPYERDVCEKTFKQKSTLVVHKRIHTGEKPFECNIFNKMFSETTNLINYKKIHTGEKPFECNVCKKTFYQKSYLVKHNIIHTGEKSFEFNNICKSLFNIKSCFVKLNRMNSAITGGVVVSEKSGGPND